MSAEFRLGAFIVLTLSILAAGVFVIGEHQSMFTSTYRVEASFKTVSGLAEGADVEVGGIREGTVRKIDLSHRPDHTVTVVMDLSKKTHDVIKKDSVAFVKSQGLLGDKYVEISFGSDGANSLKNGETIEGVASVEFDELLKKTNEILDTAKSATENVDVTTDRLKSISSKIDQGDGTIGELINDKTIYQQAAAGTMAFRDDMDALKHNFLLKGFFNSRGYTDADELKKNEIARLPSEQYVKEFTYDPKRLFDKTDTAKLKNQKLLNEAGKFLEGQQFGLVVISASAGMKGDAEKQRQLTEARTMVVRKYLVDNFRLDDTRIKTRGLGKAQDADDPNDIGTLKILIYPQSSKPPVGSNPASGGQ